MDAAAPLPVVTTGAPVVGLTTAGISTVTGLPLAVVTKVPPESVTLNLI